MSAGHIAEEGLLVLPHLHIQNANAISSPLTHGFPSITAFAGFMWALERKLMAAGIDLGLTAVGVICHAHQEQTVKGYVQTFCLPRHPANEKGEPAAIVEEGRIHLDITLVFSTFWKDNHTRSIFLQDMEDERADVCTQLAQLIPSMRVAGGSIMSPESVAQLLSIAEDSEQRTRDFRRWRRQWLPGFALIGRDDLLQKRLQALQAENPALTTLDAWLDLSRFNWRAKLSDDEKVKWEHDRKAWIVPIPVGYGALSPLHDPGTVRHARDTTVPFCFVESLYSIGQWISPHRLHDADQLLWTTENQPEQGVYRLRNHYLSASQKTH